MTGKTRRYAVADLLAAGKLIIGDGYRAKNDELSPTGLPFVRAGNINNGFSFDGGDCFPLEALNRVGNKVSEAGDVVFTSKGTVGRFALVRPTTPRFVYSPQLCFWRALDRDLIDPGYLYYWMSSSREFFLQYKGVAGQTDMAEYVSLTDQRKMHITLPDVGEQRNVVRVLGTLDDKIDLNLRMNQTLEAMAQALFRSWFVDFDPVRAKFEGRQPDGMDAATAALFPSRFIESEIGGIPEGWWWRSLGDVIDIFDSERVPLSSREREQRRGPFPYYGAASAMDSVDAFLFDGIYVLVGEDGSVIDTSDRPVLQYVWGKFWVNNHAHVLRGRAPVSTEHILLALKHSNIRPFVTGAVQPKLNQANMKRIGFVLPTSEICMHFADAIQPLYAKLRANVEENRALAELRDAILPKLLSGEIRVRDAEAQLAATA